MNKKHIPRKFNQANILRSIVLNINDRIKITKEDLKIDDEIVYEAYYKSLIKENYITKIDGKDDYNTLSYIVNMDKVKNLNNNLYNKLEKYIVPILINILSGIIK